jgi:hypothetical protein
VTAANTVIRDSAAFTRFTKWFLSTTSDWNITTVWTFSTATTSSAILYDRARFTFCKSSPSPAVVQPQFPPGVKVAQGDQQIPVPQQQSIGAQRSPSANAPQQLQPQLQQRSTMSSGFPGSLSDLVVSFESVKQKGLFYWNCLAICL